MSSGPSECSSSGSTVIQTPSTSGRNPSLTSVDLPNAHIRFQRLLVAHQQALLEYPAKYSSENANALDDHVHATKDAILADHQYILDSLADVAAHQAQIQSIEDGHIQDSQRWEEALAKQKADSDLLRLSLQEDLYTIQRLQSTATTLREAAQESEEGRNQAIKEIEVANKARQTAERLRDELCKQNIHSNLQLIRSKEERDSALIDMARMTEIRNKARAEAREARQEIEILEAALRRYEVGWEAGRTLGSVLGQGSNKRMIDH
jgi:hypothetical protein